MAEVLEVTPREECGKLRNRRLRQTGKLPAVLYGHGEDSVNLAVPTDQLEAALRHGSQVVELQGGAKGQALVQDIQWDVFQQHVLHVDLLRVDASDRVTVEVPLVLHGVAPGESEGGVVEIIHRTVEIESSPAAIPDHLEVNVNDLHVGGSLKVSDLMDLPAEAKAVLDAETTLVQCVEKAVVSDDDESADAGSVEPEVIGRKEEEGDESSGG